VAISSRILPSNLNVMSLLTNPLILALVIYAVLGMLLFSIALQNGSVTHVYAATIVTETTIPTIVGLIFLGDRPRHGAWVVMLLGLIVVTLGTTALALSNNYRTSSG